MGHLVALVARWGPAAPAPESVPYTPLVGDHRMYDIRIVSILTANDDGSQFADPSAAAIADSIDQANKVYNPHGLNFMFDPATDIYRLNDDMLNRDSRRRDHLVYTNPDVAPEASGDPAFEVDLMNDHRNEVARRFPGRATIYFTMGSRYAWSQAEKRWIYGPRGYSWSNFTDEFVSLAADGAGGDLMAHELGHYLHLDHVFSSTPPTIPDAAALIKKFVEIDGGAKDLALNIFDGDGIPDTPPAAGPQLFKNQCDPAETSVDIPVAFSDGSSRTYTLKPDRENIMNYWNKTCRGGVGRITVGQSQRIHDALRTGNRNHLVAPAVLYFGSFGMGDRSQTRAIVWAIGDFAKRFNDELAAGRQCVHMQAYDMGGGQIRWNGVWEAGGNHGQSRAIAWTIGDFAKRFNDELAVGRRCVHMQAYDMGGGQIRWDGVWEAGGNHGQSRAIAWAIGDFAKRFSDELAAGRRCVHMQAYDMGGGQIRWDGVWEAGGNHGQSEAIAWTISDFAKQFNDELAAGRRCVHMQAYNVGGGQIRWDGVWEAGGNHGQSRAIAWAFNDFIRRWDQEMINGKRLVHMQSYDMGSGDLRFDGIWEAVSDPQKRVMGLQMVPFARHFDELTSSGWHVEHMSAVLRI
jgi:hypothetical protein